MTKTKSDLRTKQDTEFLLGTFWIVLFVFVFAIAIVSFYVYQFGANNISLNPAEWGAFGDYVGGLVNPAAGIATVILVFLTLAVQRKELKASLSELKVANVSAAKMSFEQSLFAWLANYHSLISAIEVPNIASGRKALNHWYSQKMSPKQVVSPDEHYHPDFGVIGNYFQIEQMLMRLNISNEGMQKIAPFLQRAIANYQGIYSDNRTDLDAPFRTLFRLVRWVDESELTVSQKWHYVALVRAQLSWIEQVFLFYNCLTTEGEKMAFYANRYALFDNLVGGDGIIFFAANDYTNCPAEKRPINLPGLQKWPLLPSAFSSKMAKKALEIAENT
jgi:Putative phage abortive infection protein